jgi:predicted dehydrogenase
MSRDLPFVSRRRFVAGSAALAAGLAARGLSAQGEKAASAAEKLNVAVVGAGGRGMEDLKELQPTGVNIVALCDCDSRRAAASFANYPRANRYTDWRKMLDNAKDFDAVVVATPDHNHAIVSIHAMKLGKHVYCEKPLAHSIWEAREMANVAAENRVATQMGTQGHAFEGTRQAVEVLQSGAIGPVRELHVWTNRPMGWWRQGVTRPTATPPVPDGLDWDVWLGPAPARPYNPAYVPFKWRGWWDFGTGPIGDMGIHNLDTAFWGLELTAPTAVRIRDCAPALSDPSARETLPLWSTLEIDFPARGDKPPVKMTWYDGGKLPPAELFHGVPVPNIDGGSLSIGTEGSLLTRTWHGGERPGGGDWFVLVPREKFRDFPTPAKTLPRVASHHQEWVDACRGRGKTLSNFGYASVLTESLLLGDLALRTGQDLTWDSAAMRATNCPDAKRFIHPEFREGWSL